MTCSFSVCHHECRGPYIHGLWGYKYVAVLNEHLIEAPVTPFALSPNTAPVCLTARGSGFLRIRHFHDFPFLKRTRSLTMNAPVVSELSFVLNAFSASGGVGGVSAHTCCKVTRTSRLTHNRKDASCRYPVSFDTIHDAREPTERSLFGIFLALASFGWEGHPSLRQGVLSGSHPVFMGNRVVCARPRELDARLQLQVCFAAVYVGLPN